MSSHRLQQMQPGERDDFALLLQKRASAACKAVKRRHFTARLKAVPFVGQSHRRMETGTIRKILASEAT
jgi:hypothetical protein